MIAAIYARNENVNIRRAVRTFRRGGIGLWQSSPRPANFTASFAPRCASVWKRGASQTQAGAVTADAVDLIVTRAAVPILQLLEDRPPERALALVPSLLRLVLAAVLEAMGERERSAPRRPESEGGRR
jgi:hypothetical protein